jgi:hypothetical protein
MLALGRESFILLYDVRQDELDTLQKKWRKRIDMQQKDMSRRSHWCASSCVAVVWNTQVDENKAHVKEQFGKYMQQKV